MGKPFLVRTTRRLAGIAAIVAAALVSLPVAATAHDHEPPAALLVDEEAGEQEGVLGSFCWAGPGPSYRCARAVWRSPTSIPAGGSAVITLLKAQPPRDYHVLAWKRANRWGPIGKPRELDVALMPRVSSSGAGWDLSFDIPSGWPEAYLVPSASWADEDGQVLVQQSAQWVFHVRPPTRAAQRL